MLNLNDVCFCIIDFETVTPKGRPPEPIEMAGLKIIKGVVSGNPFEEMMLPPGGAQLSAFDKKQTGLTETELRQASPIETVLQRFQQWLGDDVDCLVAQHAPYEGAILYRYAQGHEKMTRLPLVDVIQFAKRLLPELSNYTLDHLAHHFELTIPKNRHRALPDVLLTKEIFLRLLHQAQTINGFVHLSDVLRIAEIKSSRQLTL